MPTTYAIPNGRTVMDATLYTGTGAVQSINNSDNGTTGFKPDLVWMKRRNGAGDNNLFDSVRGVYKDLYSNNTAAEATYTDSLTAFNSNGWSLGTDASGNFVNTNGQTYVGWQWQAGQGTTSSNTSGSTTSTVSVNQTAGFSIVTYAGSATNPTTVGHGLGVAPTVWIIKNRSGGSGAYNWVFNYVLNGVVYYMFMNTTQAQNAQGSPWSTLPTSTVFTLGGSGSDTNTNATGNNYVAYCFAPVAGYSAFGTYTGNGSTDGPFIYTGFRPKFILVKATSGALDWEINDSSRNTYNASNYVLYPDLSAAETSTYGYKDFLSNGFKIRTSDGNSNTNGTTYIYMAFAENPFKYANAR